MLGKRTSQRGLFEADHQYLDFVGEDTFYGFLAQRRGELFGDEAFAMLYCLDNGRASVPPSLLALPLRLQAHDRVSDADAKRRADFDLWMTCTCPAGQMTDRLANVGSIRDGGYAKGQACQFEGAVCAACEVRPACTRARSGRGRTVSLHPQERLLQEARALQESPAFGEYQRMRQASEHRLARMIQLGMRQARYFGRTKTLF